MGFYVDCDGELKTRAVEDGEINALLKALGASELTTNSISHALDRFNNAVEINKDEVDTYVCIYIWGYNSYDHDETKSFLKALAPFLQYGSIEYKGEDGSMWRFRFKEGNWYGEEGHIVYENSDKPI